MFGTGRFQPLASPQHDPLGGFGFDGAVVEEMRLTRGVITDDPKAAPVNFRNSFIEEQDDIPAVLGAESVFRKPLQSNEASSMQTESVGRFTRSQRGVNAVTSRRNVPADATWVTVFGFQPAMAAQVKAQVEQIMRADIVDYRQACGNYMHIKFRTHTEAKNALQLTGHILENGIMIGVVPCVSTLMEEDRGIQPKALVKVATIPSNQIYNQPSILDPIWRLLDYIFEY